MDGRSRERYLSLCKAHDSSQRRAGERVRRDILTKEERKKVVVSADYLSTSVINAQSRILEASQRMCMCVFENQMTRAALK